VGRQNTQIHTRALFWLETRVYASVYANAYERVREYSLAWPDPIVVRRLSIRDYKRALISRAININMLRNLVIQSSTAWRRCYCRKVNFPMKSSANKLKTNSITFEQLGVKPYLVKTLRQQGILYPTEVQQLSIPKTLAGKHCAIQSETGSGKSLTFLIPALQDDKPGLRTVIVAPTRELGAQLHHMVKSICPKGSGRRIISLFSGIDNPITVCCMCLLLCCNTVLVSSSTHNSFSSSCIRFALTVKCKCDLIWKIVHVCTFLDFKKYRFEI